jgi:GT2 family glycosyltransferase
MFTRQRNLAKHISIVIITRNRSRDLAHTLQQLRSQPVTVPVIVVDNHSTDDTLRVLAEQFPEVKVIPLAENKGALGRNIGVEYAQTPFIAFCDDDSWWEADAYAKALKYFKDYPKVGLIAGRILVKDQKKLDPTSALQSISPLEPTVDMPGPAILGFLGCGVIVRKKAFQQVGGYNDQIYFSGEEELLGIDLAAAGWGLTYCDDIVGYHYPSTIRDMASRYRMGARNVVQAAWLRRPTASALTRTLFMAREGLGNKDKAMGLIQGLTRLPTLLANRQPIPDWLEEQIETLEQQNEAMAAAAEARHRPISAETLSSELA